MKPRTTRPLQRQCDHRWSKPAANHKERPSLAPDQEPSRHLPPVPESRHARRPLVRTTLLESGSLLPGALRPGSGVEEVGRLAPRRLPRKVDALLESSGSVPPVTNTPPTATVPPALDQRVVEHGRVVVRRATTTTLCRRWHSRRGRRTSASATPRRLGQLVAGPVHVRPPWLPRITATSSRVFA